MSLREYLSEITRMIEAVQGVPVDKRVSLQGYVLRHGFEFSHRPLPAGVSRGVIKECFANAVALIQSCPEYTYCEGFALSVIPVHHAWCIDSDGHVVDPTWSDATASEAEYFGIPMDNNFVIEYIIKRGCYGILDDWQNGFPVLMGKIDINDIINDMYMKIE